MTLPQLHLLFKLLIIVVTNEADIHDAELKTKSSVIVLPLTASPPRSRSTDGCVTANSRHQGVVFSTGRGRQQVGGQ